MIRFDAAIARLGVELVRDKYRDPSLRMFMPWPKEETPAPASTEEVMAFLVSSVRKKD